jgi:hypothetical protein
MTRYPISGSRKASRASAVVFPALGPPVKQIRTTFLGRYDEDIALGNVIIDLSEEFFVNLFIFGGASGRETGFFLSEIAK